MSARKNLVGIRFGRLLVTQENSDEVTAFCDCGKTVTAARNSLLRGDKKSCGCLRSEMARERAIIRNTKHGICKNGIPGWYETWRGMMRRCTDEAAPNYAYYGGRGISVCARWHDPLAFFSDMGERTPGHSIERIDNDGNYCPQNCRWLPIAEQMRNRRNVHWIEFNGQRRTLTEWAKILGFSPSYLLTKLKRFPLEIALSRQRQTKNAP